MPSLQAECDVCARRIPCNRSHADLICWSRANSLTRSYLRPPVSASADVLNSPPSSKNWSNPEMEPRAHPGGGADPAFNVRFGPFEVDLRGGELRKAGRKIRLQEQPFQILRMLLGSPGGVVSREEIRKRL